MNENAMQVLLGATRTINFGALTSKPFPKISKFARIVLTPSRIIIASDFVILIGKLTYMGTNTIAYPNKFCVSYTGFKINSFVSLFILFSVLSSNQRYTDAIRFGTII